MQLYLIIFCLQAAGELNWIINSNVQKLGIMAYGLQVGSNSARFSGYLTCASALRKTRLPLAARALTFPLLQPELLFMAYSLVINLRHLCRVHPRSYNAKQMNFANTFLARARLEYVRWLFRELITVSFVLSYCFLFLEEKISHRYIFHNLVISEARIFKISNRIFILFMTL